MPGLTLAKWLLGAALLGALGVGAPPLAAQDSVPSARVPDATAAPVDTTATPAPTQDRWSFSFAPYAWAAGETGQVGVEGAVANVDVGLKDAVDQINLAFSSVLEARRARWIGTVDLHYFSLSDDQTVAVAGGDTGTVQFSQDQFVLQPALGFTLLVRPWGGIDALAGARYWHMSAELGASVSGAEVAAVSRSRDWVDGTVGIRVRVRPGPRWRLFARGDVGGGGSKFTWQALGGLGYDVGDCCTALAAYRHLDVDYESDGFVNNLYMSGPALGFELRF
jgi:hypothetical protein